jgi:hypothetical protein
MNERDDNSGAGVWAWLARRPGQMLLSGDEEALSGEPAERFARAWVGLLAASLLWGLAMLAVWGAAWRVFQDYSVLILPPAAVGALFCLGPFRRGTVALADELGGRDATARAVAAAVVVLVLGLCLVRLYSPYERLDAWWIKRLLPGEKFYRVLVLMPLWGAWAMTIAVKFCRPTERTAPQVRAFERGCPAPAAAGWMAALLAVSLICFHHLGPGSQLGIPVVTIFGAILSGLVLCRRHGGPDRSALLAANVLTQIVFVLAYLAGREFRL